MTTDLPAVSRGGAGTRTLAGIGAVTALSRAAGLVRILVVAYVLGTTFLGNAFQSANAVSNVLFELLAAGALSAVLVPALVSHLDAADRRGAEEVAGGMLAVALAGLGAVAVVGIVAAPWLATLLTLGVPEATADEQRELVTLLLRFFIPQVLLYAAGTIAVAALHAQRRFLAAAAAPIGNTLVMVGALLGFRLLAGGSPTLDLDAWERFLLVVAGTGGVVAYVAVLVGACRRSGFRLRPRWPNGDPRVTSALRAGGWGVVLHTGAGILQGAAMVGGAAIAGGVVAYQVGWVCFLAPYGILAQPIHTAILPEMVGEAARPEQLARSIRWSLERMAIVTLPVAAGLAALAGPGMRLVAFGATGEQGAALLDAALWSLALGLFPYSAFLLLARAAYAMGDSRLPGVVALAAAVAGAAGIALVAPLHDGAARVAVLGLAHSGAYTVAALVLGVVLSRRLGVSLVPRRGAALALLSVAVGGIGRVVAEAMAGDGGGTSQPRDVAVVAAVSVGGAAVVLAAYRLLGIPGSLTTRVPT